ncbi:cytokinin dehydrogenase 3-like protein [Tanacetum coccineum]
MKTSERMLNYQHALIAMSLCFGKMEQMVEFVTVDHIADHIKGLDCDYWLLGLAFSSGLRIVVGYSLLVLFGGVCVGYGMWFSKPKREWEGERCKGEGFEWFESRANAPAGNAPSKPSYATATGKPSGKKVNVRTLYTPGGNGIDVVVLVDSIRAISERFANTAYGFFLGKKVAYPVVANYVRNTWGKYGLVRSMFSSSTGLFSFQFSSIDGLDAMLENGPWFIRNNPLILKKWHPDENLLKEDVSTVPVWVKLHGVPVTAFSEDGLSAIATKLGTPLMLDSYTSDMCMQSWGRSSYARVMIELRADVELKDNIVMAMSKITREGHYTCNVRVEYEWKPPRCLSCKVFRHIHEECPKNTGASEKKTVKKPSQTTRGVEPTIEVSNSNPFDVLNSVDNDVEFGTNGGNTNLGNNGATSSGSSFMNIDNDGEFASNTPIGEKIDKIERQIYEGKLRLLNNDGNPLVPTGIVESDSEVDVVYDETANLRISSSGKEGSDKGYSTNSLLKQWRDSYPDNDDYDPYDDDMYENHDLSEHLQSVCDDLDITAEMWDSPTSFDWKLFQMDVNNAFPYGSLSEDVYMLPPLGFFDKDDKRVCKLKRSLYGLKHAPRQWNHKIYETLVEDDDLVITRNSETEIENFKSFLNKKFKIKDLGELKYFLGIEVLKTKNGLCLNQRKYCLELLHEFGLLACRPVVTPLPENTVLSQKEIDDDKFLRNITSYQKLLKYLKLAPGSGINFTKSNTKFNVISYTDSDWAKCPKSKKHATLSKSSAEAEYIAMASATSNPVMHEKTKHFDIDVHIVREKVASGLIKTVKVDSKYQVADVLTKALGSVQHSALVKKLGIVNPFVS